MAHHSIAPPEPGAQGVRAPSLRVALGALLQDALQGDLRQLELPRDGAAGPETPDGRTCGRAGPVSQARQPCWASEPGPRSRTARLSLGFATVRLLLASYLLGDHGRTLRRLVGDGIRAAIVMNAADGYGDSRLSRLPREQKALEDFGFECEELDLRGYFGDEEGLRQRLESLDLLWVPGGNTFVLARAMALSGFHQAATDTVKEGRLVYGGYSAGACVVGPDLRGIHLMDETDVVPEGYPPDVQARTLGWVPWTIVPHWRSEHPESPAADLAVEHLVFNELPFRTLRDGEAIIIDGDPTSSM